jgi:hypothetical protein
MLTCGTLSGGICDGPVHIAGHDLDGDGTIDVLAAANFRSHNVSVWQRAGGSFELSQLIDVAGTPRAVRFGQINNDGDIDLVVANHGADSVWVLLGDGEGNLVLSATLGGLDAPSDLVLADLDGDGDLDLSVANTDADSVSVYLNEAGTFQSRQDYSVGAGPRSVAPGDLNGDGILDLAVAAGGSGAVWVLMGDGQAGFVTAVDFTIPPVVVHVAGGGDEDQPRSYLVRSSPHTLAIAELDGSGRPEIVVGPFAAGASVHFHGVSELVNPDSDDLLESSHAIQSASQPVALSLPAGLQAMDVNRDGHVSPLDALLVINQMNLGAGEAAASASAHLDVSGDQVVSPLDALLVINYLNQVIHAEAVDAALSAWPTQ